MISEGSFDTEDWSNATFHICHRNKFTYDIYNFYKVKYKYIHQL